MIVFGVFCARQIQTAPNRLRGLRRALGGGQNLLEFLAGNESYPKYSNHKIPLTIIGYGVE